MQLFIEGARPNFERVGATLPNNIRASIGFTSKGARSNTIGECWNKRLSEDDCFEIFIAPIEKDGARIADILTHELVHAALSDAGHGKEFRRVATSLGLCGKMTATEAGPGWFEWAQPLLDYIGPYPGSALETQPTGKGGGKKKQTTRQIKCECLECGFIFRASNIWLEGRTLRCPNAICNGKIKHGSRL